MMGQGSGYGIMGTAGSSSGTPNSQAGTGNADGSQTLTLLIKSDSEYARRGSDGNWHDAFCPLTSAYKPRHRVTVTVSNYDDMPHSFTSSSLAVNATIPAGSASAPSKTTFTFTAPSKPGGYEWWCALPCDPWAMAHDGYMRGYVTVRA